MYTTALNDSNPEERRLGIEAGFEFRRYAELTVVYEDFGISYGMVLGIKHARDLKQTIEYRKIL